LSRRRRKKNKQPEYKLYAFEPTEENLKAVQDSRFYRITTKYILLYDCNQRTTNYNVIGENELHYLSYQDKQWLLDCNMAIIAEETKHNEAKIANSMGLMIDRLEVALESERAKDLNDNAGKQD